MKKILILVLTLSIVLTSFAFTGITANADDNAYTETIKFITSQDGDFATKEVKEGRNSTHYGRTASATTYIYWSLPTASIPDGKALMFEGAFFIGDNVSKVSFSSRNNGTLNVGIDSEAFIAGQWNDIKMIWQNVEKGSGSIYINGKFLKNFTSGTLDFSSGSTTTLHFRSTLAGVDQTAEAVEEAWISYGKLSVVDNPDQRVYLYNFDGYTTRDTENNKSDIGAYVASDATPGEETKMNGVYGRSTNDKSWYFARYASNPPYMNMKANSKLKTSFDAAGGNRDLVYEASVLFENDNMYASPGIGGTIIINTSSDMYTPNVWNKLKIIIDVTGKTADVYINGELKADDVKFKADVAGYDNTALRLTFFSDSGTTRAGYINNMYIYHVPHGTETGVETVGLTGNVDGFEIDYSTNTILTKGVANYTESTLKTALGIANDVDVRVYSDAKCETRVTGNLASGYKVAVSNDSGIIQLFTIIEDTRTLFITDEGVATFTPAEAVNGVLIVAAYTAKGLLIDLDTTPVIEGTTSLTSTVADADHYKAFVFDSVSTAVPLVPAVSTK